MITCTRKFGIDAGHRVFGHESKCAHAHGHRYSIEVTVGAPLDNLGRVVDFSVLKERVGEWLDRTMDHAFLVHPDDPLGPMLRKAGHRVYVMPVDTNPTAENIAAHVAERAQLMLPDLLVTHVRVWETPNCFADWTYAG